MSDLHTSTQSPQQSHQQADQDNTWLLRQLARVVSHTTYLSNSALTLANASVVSTYTLIDTLPSVMSDLYRSNFHIATLLTCLEDTPVSPEDAHVLEEAAHVFEQVACVLTVLEDIFRRTCDSYDYRKEDSISRTLVSNCPQNFNSLLSRYPFVIRKMIFLEGWGRDVYAYLDALGAWLRPKTERFGQIIGELYHFYEDNTGRLWLFNVVPILENPDNWIDDKAYDLTAFHKEYFAID